MEPAPPSTPLGVEHQLFRLRVGSKRPRSGPSLDLGGRRRTAGKGKFTHVTSQLSRLSIRATASVTRASSSAGLSRYPLIPLSIRLLMIWRRPMIKTTSTGRLAMTAIANICA